MRLCLWVACYILAISFQLAGALLLIIRYWFMSEKEQLKLLEKKRAHMEGEVLVLGENQPNDSEMVEEIWINRFAFAYIAIGYLLGIWGETYGANKCVITVFVALFAIALVIVGKKVSTKKSAKFKRLKRNRKKSSFFRAFSPVSILLRWYIRFASRGKCTSGGFVNNPYYDYRLNK